MQKSQQKSSSCSHVSVMAANDIQLLINIREWGCMCEYFAQELPNNEICFK